MKSFIFILLLGLGTLIWRQPALPLNEQSLETVLTKLGEKPVPHRPNLKLKGVSAEKGRQLVIEGITTNPNGKKTKQQSAHFVCTSCHNVERDLPDLTNNDPQARLEYVAKKGLPMTPGSALYGIVNRSDFYNDDYFQKYGDLVYNARNDVREAIQLCATECAQGRRLLPWEMESILAYLWTLELQMDDLQLSAQETAQIENALTENGDKRAAAALLYSKYQRKSPATFALPPADRKTGYPDLVGDKVNGKLVFETACLHCHEHKRYSFFELDTTDKTRSFLARHIDNYTRYSIYQVGRYGTSPLPGKRAYMPNFTLEKMSHQQLEDLRAYLENRTDEQ